ncbi:TolC family protein [Gramella jeungdoensis]|uniref:TolC family protein n=1 Tax=Gramella jeungdoensis TaxID=708091 RepID=A0ABT0Z5B4_9FLAO|nr:TolC family protein [Gramella jeungdoensis]MCM8570625.1 TolC family protein [Gramella jeungdoensis]
MRILGISILFILLPLTNFAQESDTLYLEFKEYLDMVKANHPVVKQAGLLLESADANLQKARGGFDPKLESNYDRKEFKETEYFDILNAGFKIPTWYGIELKAKYENNSGEFLNPQNKVPKDGLFAAGISIPVGQGLFINERMAALKQAKVFRKQSQAEQQLMLNEILYEAATAYFEWQMSYRELKLFQDFRKNAAFRFKGVKTSFEAGDKPAIDTVEAQISFQNRRLELEQAELQYIKASLKLGTFLWQEDNIPLELGENLFPTQKTLENNLDIVLQNEELETHPKIRSLNYKLEALEYEKRLKANKLLPTLDLEYNFLTEDYEQLNSLNYDEYKFGLKFSLPLFLRKERGDLQLSRIKLENAGFDLYSGRLELRNKIQSIQEQLKSLENQNKMMNDLVSSYRRMLEGEERKLELGESSIFLVNSRENSLITARQKQIKLQNKLIQTRIELLKVLARLQEI